MVKLNNFIINSDFDTMKIYSSQVFNVTVPAFTITDQDTWWEMQGYSFDFNVPSDVDYFESCSLQSSLEPGVIYTGSLDSAFEVRYPNEGIAVGYIVNIIRSARAKYTVYAQPYKSFSDPYSGAAFSKTVPQSTVTIKLNLLVPSEQQ